MGAVYAAYNGWECCSQHFTAQYFLLQRKETAKSIGLMEQATQARPHVRNAFLISLQIMATMSRSEDLNSSFQFNKGLVKPQPLKLSMISLRGTETSWNKLAWLACWPWVHLSFHTGVRETTNWTLDLIQILSALCKQVSSIARQTSSLADAKTVWCGTFMTISLKGKPFDLMYAATFSKAMRLCAGCGKDFTSLEIVCPRKARAQQVSRRSHTTSALRLEGHAQGHKY